MSTSKKRFDLNVLTNDAIKSRYQTLLKQGLETLDSLNKGYRKDNDDLKVDAFYYDSTSLNAFVDKEGPEYRLGISIAALPLLTILFDKLLGLSYVIPELTATATPVVYEIPFALDVSKGELDTRFDIKLSDERALMSSLLSTLCLDFIVLHEVGHIACGHAEGYFQITGRKQLSEHSRVQTWNTYLRKSWEFEADVIASMLIVQYLNNVVELSQQEGNWRQLFSFCRDESELRCRLVALLNVALFTLFAYLNRLCLEFKFYHFHPSPMIRAYYIAEYVAGRAKRDWDIDVALFEKFQDEYLDQFLQALESISAFDCETITDDFEERIANTKKLLQRGFRRFRPHYEKWSWIPTEVWR